MKIANNFRSNLVRGAAVDSSQWLYFTLFVNRFLIDWKRHWTPCASLHCCRRRLELFQGSSVPIFKETSRGMETVTTLEVSIARGENNFPKQNRCCLCFRLKPGLNWWLALETLIWLALFFAAFFNEISYIEKNDLLDFVNESEEWYFQLIFGDRFYYFDHSVRSKKTFQNSCV